MQINKVENPHNEPSAILKKKIKTNLPLLDLPASLLVKHSTFRRRIKYWIIILRVCCIFQHFNLFGQFLHVSTHLDLIDTMNT